MGGYDGSYKNDVWYSSDGETWTQATSSAPWSARSYNTSVVYNNKIWVIGGFRFYDVNFILFKDVWYSSDGINWTQATSSAPWSARAYHTSVVYDNKIWVMGGEVSSGNRWNDVWYSSNGINWTRATPVASWSGRAYHTSVVYDNNIWVMGGYVGSNRWNDVWFWWW